jgi:hypothetical protein
VLLNAGGSTIKPFTATGLFEPLFDTGLAVKA